MTHPRTWQDYAPTYRAREMAHLAGWVAGGASGSVVGMGGAGKSNLLGFLCHRPDALDAYLPADVGSVAVVLVDLNDLPSGNLATFYRVLLRAFFEAREYFEPEMQAQISRVFVENRAVTDPFVVQTALRELLLACRASGLRVVLVMDRFDKFCASATPQLTDTLRGLRDHFKDSLTYIVGMRQEIAYLIDRTLLGELYEVLDTHVCWVGAMAEPDARALIAQEAARAAAPPSAEATAKILALTGGYPALLKAVCHWWQGQAISPLAEWPAALLAEPSVRNRIEELWDGLTQAEQLALAEAQRLRARAAALAERGTVAPDQVHKLVAKSREELDRNHGRVLERLAERGLCARTDDGWAIPSGLVAAYLGEEGSRVQGRGRIWREAGSGEIYQGQAPLPSLANLERRLLEFLLDHPRARYAKTAVIEQVWPDEVVAEGLMDDALYQVVKELRRKIEPEPSAPRYLVTWRGRPEGGYQFFPEGRPGAGQ